MTTSKHFRQNGWLLEGRCLRVVLKPENQIFFLVDTPPSTLFVKYWYSHRYIRTQSNYGKQNKALVYWLNLETIFSDHPSNKDVGVQRSWYRSLGVSKGGEKNGWDFQQPGSTLLSLVVSCRG